MTDKELIERLKYKCKVLEELLDSKRVGLNSYYLAEIKPRQRKFSLPEGIEEGDILHRIIDRKKGIIVILIK